MSTQIVRLHAVPTSGRVSPLSLLSLDQKIHEQGDSTTGEESTQTGDKRPSAATEAELQVLLAALAERAAELEATHAKLLQEVPTLAIQLAVGIAKELLRSEIGAGNYDVEAIVRKGLAVASTGRSACTIHLHPDDLASCDPSRFRSNTRFEADPDIARGDVHITTPQGLLVHDIDAALIRVREELIEATR